MTLRHTFISIVVCISFTLFLHAMNQPAQKAEEMLLQAARGGSSTLVRELITKAFNKINYKDKNYMSALDYAAKYGHTEVVKILLACHTLVPTTDYEPDIYIFCESSIFWAASEGHFAVVKLLIEDKRFKYCHNYVLSLINYFGRYDTCHLIIPLLDAVKQKINDKDEDGYTLLMRLVNFCDDYYYSDEECDAVQQAIDYLVTMPETSINARSLDNMTPLMIAALCGVGDENVSDYFTQTVKKLLSSKKSEVDAQDTEGNTALMYAAESQHSKAIEYLLRMGKAQINMQNNDGDTALHKAIKAHDIASTLVFLRRRDIDLGVKNKKEKTALELSREYASKINSSVSKDICFFIVKKKIALGMQDMLLKAIEDGDMTSFKLLIKNMTLHVWDSAGNNPLHKAIIKNNLQMTGLIIYYVPSLLDKPNDNKQTPLELAVKNHEMLKFLMGLKSHLKFRDNSYKEPAYKKYRITKEGLS